MGLFDIFFNSPEVSEQTFENRFYLPNTLISILCTSNNAGLMHCKKSFGVSEIANNNNLIKTKEKEVDSDNFYEIDIEKEAKILSENFQQEFDELEELYVKLGGFCNRKQNFSDVGYLNHEFELFEKEILRNDKGGNRFSQFETNHFEKSSQNESNIYDV